MKLPSVRWPVLLLVASVGLTALGLFEANRAVRSHRRIAERALHDYAGFVAWSYEQHLRENFARGTQTVLGAVNHGDGMHSYPKVPDAASLPHYLPFDPKCGCHRARPGADPVMYFAYVLGSDTLGVARNTHPDATEGWEVDRPMPTVVQAAHRVTYTPEERRWINDTLTRQIHAGRSDSRFPIVIATRDSVPRILVYTLMPTTWGDTLVYGAEYTRADVERVLAEVMYEQRLIPATFAQGRSIRELIQLQVSDRAGRVLFQSEPVREWFLDDSARMSSGYGSLLVRAQINPAMAGAFIIGGLPRSRLPFLFALLAVAVALSVVAIGQMRREAELSRLRADFVANTSHELRTPLAQMRLYLETQRLGRFKTAAEREWSLGNVERETVRLQHLVERVLRFSRSGRPDDEVTEPVDACAEVEEIIGEFAPLAASRDCRIELKAEAVPLLMLRPGAMRHIVLNLLDNAVKYGPAHQVVTVLVRNVDGAVQIEVIDQGAGIASSDRASVWRPYERGSTAAHVAGSGIGLAIVRDVARQHGGDAWVADSASNEGAHFVISLPIGNATVVRDAVGERGAPATGAGLMARVLVVEDNTSIAEGIAYNLRHEQHETRIAEDGDRALSLAREWKPELIILDLMIPVLDGYGVLEQLRAEQNRVPVIILTARGEEADKVRGFRLDADQYVTKPFGVLELLERVSSLLRRRAESANVHNADGLIRFADVVVDPASRTVRRRGQPCALTPKAFDLLLALVHRRGSVASREELLREVWGYGAFVLSRTVDSHIAELRRKIEVDAAEPRHIITVWKVGYRFDSGAS